MGETDRSNTTTVPPDASSVTTLNERVEQHFEDIETFRPVQCHGEVTNVNRHESGVFFTLTDTSCEIRCVCWPRDHDLFDFTISDGMDVVLDGTLGYYPPRGSLQLYANDVTRLGTDTQTTAEKVADTLEARGWFDEIDKTSLPRVPERIGVVTSLDGDARHDITTSIRDSAPVDIVLQHATVQGTNVPQSIADGIQRLDRDESIDVMIVGRGGGSTTDLQAFNSELVAEAIYRATTPIITAVGHTADQLIADRVADVSVTTPREAGKTVIEQRGALWGQLDQLEDDLDDAYARIQRDHDYERHIDRAVATAHATNERRTTLYKAVIAGLVGVVIILTLLIVT